MLRHCSFVNTYTQGTLTSACTAKRLQKIVTRRAVAEQVVLAVCTSKCLVTLEAIGAVRVPLRQGQVSFKLCNRIRLRTDSPAGMRCRCASVTSQYLIHHVHGFCSCRTEAGPQRVALDSYPTILISVVKSTRYKTVLFNFKLSSQLMTDTYLVQDITML